jgi:hypothetical protein
MKPKKPQAETPNEVQERDYFLTPRYAVELLPAHLFGSITHVWEAAAGRGHISRVLEGMGLKVVSTDLRDGTNFLTAELPIPRPGGAIITNPPYSIKRQFYERCREFGLPFALLIPADYSQWIVRAVAEDGAEKIIPTRRIDYITPNILQRLSEVGLFYRELEEVPDEVLARYSTSQFHSMWLTWGFGLGRSETFVDLPLSVKKERVK